MDGKTKHSDSVIPHRYGDIAVKFGTPVTMKNGALAIDYPSWMSKISDKWPVKKRKIDRDLTKVF